MVRALKRAPHAVGARELISAFYPARFAGGPKAETACFGRVFLVCVFGRLVGRSVGRSVGWFVGWLVGWLAGWLVVLFVLGGGQPLNFAASDSSIFLFLLRGWGGLGAKLANENHVLSSEILQ